MEVFTTRIKLYNDESFFSFILRLACANGIELFHLWRMIKKDNSHYAQMNDTGLFNFNPSSIVELKKIIYMTNINESELYQSTFYYVLYTFCGESEVERSRFISGLIREEFCYCPSCMKEKAYHRLIWNVRDISVCHIHNIKLIDTCSYCNKEIRYNQIKRLSECPHCEKCFYENGEIDLVDDNELSKQSWLYNAWATLIHNIDRRLVKNDLAMKVLYILNNNEGTLNKDILRYNLINSRIIPTILQHARDTLSYKRTLHLSFLLSILYERNISMENFLNLKIPETFNKSVVLPDASKKEEVGCLAPWCKNFNKKNELIKTGTSYKRKKDGKVLLYYLACSECGCEYAFNDNDELEERTYFIKSYAAIKSNLWNKSIKQAAPDVGISVDQLKRSIAYFNDLGLVKRDDLKFINKFEQELLERVIEAIGRGIAINEIKKWGCWRGYNHFLCYRYSREVIKALLFKEVKIGKTKKFERVEELSKLKEILRKMYDEDEDITLDAVSQEMNVCIETLRVWGCNPIIEEAKIKQKEKRRILMLEKIYDLVDNYCRENIGKPIISGVLYKHLGIGRTVLWRISPEITSYIKEVIKNHNKMCRYTKVI